MIIRSRTVALVLATIVMIVTIKQCVDVERKKCQELSGMYFKGKCLKNGKIIEVSY